MNKVILGLILAVCILGMALVMLNERLGRKSEPQTPGSQVAESGYSQDAGALAEKVDLPQGAPYGSEKGADYARALEQERAREALRPPLPENGAEYDALSAEAEKEALKLAAGVQLSSESGQEAESVPLPPPVLPAEKEAAAAPSSARQAPEAARQPAQAKETPPQKPAAAPKAEPSKAEKPKSPARPQTPKAAAAKNNEIKKFVVFARENGATVRISGDGPMSWRSMVLDNPPRVALDLDGEWTFPGALGVPKNELVNAVRVGKPSGGRTRVVIDLKSKPRSSRVIAAKDGDGFDVRVDK